MKPELVWEPPKYTNPRRQYERFYIRSDRCSVCKKRMISETVYMVTLDNKRFPCCGVCKTKK